MSAPGNAQDAGPVIVCCAPSEAEQIAAALAELTSVGHTIEIVDGVLDDPHALAPVIERFHGDGLYVLCRSTELGRSSIEQLRDILLAQHVPFGRTLTVATHRSRDLLDRVKSSLARASTRKESSPSLPRTTMSINQPARPRTRTPPPRRVDEDTTTGVQPRSGARRRHATIQNLAPPPAPRSARHQQTHDVDFDPPTEPLPPAEARRRLGKQDPPKLPPLPPPPPDSAAISMTNHVVDLETHDPEISMMNASLEQLDFSDLEGPATGKSGLPPDVTHSPVGPIRTGNTKITPMPRPERRPEIPGLPDAPSSTATRPPPSADDFAPSSTATMPPPSARPLAPAPPPPAAAPPPPAPAAAAPPSSSPSAAGSFPAAAASTPAGAAASTMEDSPSRALWWAGGFAAIAIVSILLAIGLGGDDDDASGSDDESTKSAQLDQAREAAEAAKTSDAPATDDAGGPEGEDGDGDTAPAPAGDPGTTILALADREVRALDVLLVQPESAGPMSHPDALDYCAALELGGLAGWRLPEVGELYSLTEAGMVGRSMYWSQTRGDTFGDRHLAWNGRRWRAEHSSSDSRVLCVRDEQAG